MGLSNGTVLYRKVNQGGVSLPTCQQIQTQHIMAQLLLERYGYHELPVDFFAKIDADVDVSLFKQESLPSQHYQLLPLGAGARGFFDETQFYNQFSMKGYREKISTNHSPIWKCYHLDDAELFRRDVMFSFKNEPFLDRTLFINRYGESPDQRFLPIFDRLLNLNLVEIETKRISLTPKGRLVVEEIAGLFKNPELEETINTTPQENKLIAKYNFSTSYPPLA